MAAASTGIALAGIAWATKIYLRRPVEEREHLDVVKPVHTLLSQKYYVDALYEGVIVRRAFCRAFAGTVDWLDRNLVDGLVDFVGCTVRT